MNGSTASVARGDSRSRNGSSHAGDAADGKADDRDPQRRDDVGEQLAAAGHLDEALQQVASGGAKNSGPNVRAPHSQAGEQRERERNAGRRSRSIARGIAAGLRQAGCDVGAAHCTSARIVS